MSRFVPVSFLFVFILSCFVSFSANARIDIVPRKIIMDSRDRSAEVTILNLFDEEGTFRIDLVYNKQNEDGTYTVMEEPLDPNFDVSKVVRFSPRQFTLPPRGRQKVRLSLRKPADLPEGEYRFHVKALRFGALDGANKEKPQEGTSIMMVMNLGITIPVVVRHGNLESDAQLNDVRLVTANTETGQPEMHMTIARTGTQSTIGALEVIWEPQGSSETDRIGYIDNMNLFTDITKRYVYVPLRYVPQGPGAIRLRYVENGLLKTKGNVYDELLLEQ